MESSFGRGERFWLFSSRGDVAGRSEIGGCEGALILLTLRGASRGALGVQGLGHEAVRSEVACDDGGGGRVPPRTEGIHLPWIREHGCVGRRVYVKGERVPVIPGYFWIEKGAGVLAPGGGLRLRLSGTRWGGCGCGCTSRGTRGRVGTGVSLGGLCTPCVTGHVGMPG